MKHLRIRWEAIMRGTCVLAVVVARMVLKVWGLGAADGRMALGIFWKSKRFNNKKNIHHDVLRNEFFNVLGK